MLTSTLSRAFVFALSLTFSPTYLFAADWFVAAGGAGSGTRDAPFGRVQDAIDVAQPGDTVIIGSGTFVEALHSVRPGSPTLLISVKSAGSRGSVTVTAPGRVLTVSHPYFAIDGLVLDGQYGQDDLVRVTAAATRFTLRNTEVRRSGNDAIDMGAVQDVLIENSLIHHALNPAGGRTDAHGIVGGAVQRLTIRNTEIHTFSGDGIQVDAGRSAPGWNDVTIEGCRIWLAPLASAENGFAAGTVTGENAVDTKSSASYARARITIRNTETWGFRWPTVGSNIAAFNLKENIDALVDGAIVHDSEIAFRVRGPGSTGSGAWVRIQNAVIHDVSSGFRYEDNIENLKIRNVTIGSNVTRPLLAASSSAAGLDVQNLLLLGSSLPPEAMSSSNLAVPATSFTDVTSQNYQLASGSPAIDRGVSLPDVPTDALGTIRPQGGGYDVGAYERVATIAPPPLPPRNLRIIHDRFDVE
jgi:parallel beta helix pectate lyase-like protein